MPYYGYTLTQNRFRPSNPYNINTLVRNSDLVPANATSSVSTGAGVLTATADPGDHVLIKYKTDRIRQTGTISRIALAEIVDPVNVASFKFYIWRKDGSTYDKIATLDLLPLVSTGLNTLTLASPIAVQEGDFYGLHMQRAGGSNVAFIAATTLAASIMYTVSETPSDTDYAWDSKTEGGAVPRSIMYTQAPFLVGVGDSIMEGYPNHTSFVDSGFAQVSITKSWLYKLSVIDSRCVYQNLGVGGNTTTQILARFESQVIVAKPKVVILNGGVNDIANSVPKATFLLNMKTMLDRCIINGIYVNLWLIMPWTDGTNVQMQTRDEWNTDLAALAATYPNVVVQNWDLLLGQYRTEGDPGNLWDIKAAYDSDGVHLNEAGNALVASQMSISLRRGWANIPTVYTPAFQAVYDSFVVKPSSGIAWVWNRYIKRLVDCGYWATLTGFRVYAAHTTGAEALKDWKKLDRVMSTVGTVTFVAHEGQTGNGVDGYVRTGFNPYTEVGFNQNDHHFFTYCRTSRAGSATKGEGCLGASSYVAMQLKSGAGNWIAYAGGTTGASIANADTKGLHLVRRNESGKVDLWKNGVEVDPDNVANSATLPDYEYYSDAYNNAGTATYFNADQKSIEGQGSAPTDPQIVEFNDATFECMNAFGKAV